MNESAQFAKAAVKVAIKELRSAYGIRDIDQEKLNLALNDARLAASIAVNECLVKALDAQIGNH